MKGLLKTSIIPLLIIPSLNNPAKAEFEKSSDSQSEDKVTAIELDNNNIVCDHYTIWDLNLEKI